VKEKCYSDSLNSQGYVKCILEKEVEVKALADKYRMTGRYYLQRFEHCAGKDDERYIYPCLKKLRIELAPYMKEF
jgi:hypothetical protein